MIPSFEGTHTKALQSGGKAGNKIASGSHELGEGLGGCAWICIKREEDLNPHESRDTSTQEVNSEDISG